MLNPAVSYTCALLSPGVETSFVDDSVTAKCNLMVGKSSSSIDGAQRLFNVVLRLSHDSILDK